ncbi:luciferase-like monooxygenase family protein [Mycobacterium xenopi 4042]|uniref:Luciferase-like monooxygenase family protein n=1 Tax=Mycobacterium xenopi 4042 TaxID=1299334 RepID=X8AEI8_MYCXE|nr:luciferase-like monooxygenase family protein [Mycobacterium xenopi 4042]
MFSMRFDMRATAMGAPATELYATAIEMCAWAEIRGCLGAVLCEHHGSEDGYLPTPLILASAVAARTERLALTSVVLLPLYDPVRLAEEMAVLDIISRGRVSYILGLGIGARSMSTSAWTWVRVDASPMSTCNCFAGYYAVRLSSVTGAASK